MSQPYTVQFGPWSPDLANIAVQTPYQFSATLVPCADCLNVYYANGRYQSMPTPVTVSGLGQLPLGSFTAIDQNGNPQIYAGTQSQLYRQSSSGVWFTMTSGSNNAALWSFAQLGEQMYAVDACPQATDLMLTWAIGAPTAAPVGGSNVPFANVIATVGQFIMVGNVQVPTSDGFATGDGTTTTFTTALSFLPVGKGSVQILKAGVVVASDDGNGNIVGSGVSGFINYALGGLTVIFATAPANGAGITADYLQSFAARCQWSAIGNGSSWPTPLTNAALAVQSGQQDNEYDLGPLMAIVGYPLYGVVFQRSGITRASYIGAPVVFSWATFERKRGLIAPKAYCQVGAITYFLSDEGFFETDGASVSPIGTASDNSNGIDGWFWANVNKSALNAITAGFDAATRCVHFSVPTASSTVPNMILSYNPLSGFWTKSAISAAMVWTDTDGTFHRLGLFSPSPLFQYQTLTGSPATGYLETCDTLFVDGNRRLTTGVRPNINCSDTPTVVVGTRNTLEASVSYSAAMTPDTFGAGFAPFLVDALYTRVRVSSAAATAIHGATLMQEMGAGV